MLLWKLYQYICSNKCLHLNALYPVHRYSLMDKTGFKNSFVSAIPLQQSFRPTIQSFHGPQDAEGGALLLGQQRHQHPGGVTLRQDPHNSGSYPNLHCTCKFTRHVGQGQSAPQVPIIEQMAILHNTHAGSKVIFVNYSNVLYILPALPIL